MRAQAALTEFQETWLTLHRILHFSFLFFLGIGFLG
jgi:hypothetical protein